MYLKKSKNNKTGRTYLYIADGYHDREKGYTKTITVQSLGYLDVLEKQYDDPIAHFTEVVKQMNEEKKQQNLSVPMQVSLNDKLEINTNNLYNFGYAALSKIYHELEIDKFLISKFKSRDVSEFKINNIIKLLTFSRCLFPDSKKSTYDNRNIFFENTNFSLKEVYNTLTYIEPFKESLQSYIYDHIQEQYKPKNECVFYDVTNYYFEIDDNDDFRKKGVSKEHRPNPIVQMGLFMDSLGLPMCYGLFPGNTNDCLTLKPMVQKLQTNYNIGKVIVVADKGLNTGEIIEAKSQLSLDEEKIAEEEKLDGYYAIVSSEFNKTDDEIIDIYRGLWRIEETFKVTKSELEDRPIYVSTKEHIEAHFLTCYLALVLCRVLQHKLNKKYSVEKILESLKQCNCSHIENNYYLFNYFDDILKDIGDAVSIDFSNKYMRLQEIKKNLAETKK